MANTSILAAFERMWQHTVALLGNKSDISHTHNDMYYTEDEVDTKISAVNTSIANITNGTTKVGKASTADSATSATSADFAISATKATQDGNGNAISSTYETKSDATAKLTEAKTYADNAANTVKNDLLNGAGGAYDTLKELGDLIDDNQDAIDALEEVAAGKADKNHTHAITDVSGLQTALNGKADSSHGTHVSYSTTAPVMDGTASVGTASTVARSDHKHPTDTSRASKTEFDTHTSNTTLHITSTERSNWNTAKTHADSTHAPSNAEKNQNAFSNIAVSGQTTVAADTTTDTLTLVGSNVTITTDATNDKVTFTVADGTTSAKGVVQLTNSTSSTSTTTAATPSSVKSAYDLANTAKTAADAAQASADGKVDLSSNQTVGGNKVFTGTTSTMVLHTYNPLYINNGTDNSKNTSLYTNDSNVFAVTSSANDMTFNGESVALLRDVRIPTATTDGTGAAYTATVSGIPSLTVGASFIMIPHTVSTAAAPTLNVNGLGAKSIRRRTTQSTTSTSTGYNASWLSANKPIRVEYDGTFWIADLPKPLAADMSGTLTVKNGGTGKTTVTSGSYLVGNGTSALTEKTPAEVLSDIGAAPAYTYGTSDLTAGVSTLETGKVYFVYE